MKNLSKICAGLILMLLIVGVANGVASLIVRDLETIPLSQQIISLESKLAEHIERLENCEQFSLFKQAAIKIGSRTWDENDYNCVDFSIDLVKELKESGIKSSIAIAEERTHAWVLVWIEATTGEFVNPDSELEILEIRNGKMEVICNYK